MNRALSHCLALLLLGCGLFWPPAAHADITCQASVRNGGINFGTVDPSQPAGTDAQAAIDYICSSTEHSAETLTLCFNIGYGSQGAATDGNRQMAGSSAPNLEFQLYGDATLSQIAGSINEPSMPQPISASFLVPKRHGGNPGIFQGSATVHARLFGSQASPAGSYIANFTPALTGAFGQNVPCNQTQTDGVSTFSPFTVAAQILPACSAITATDLDFGQNTGLLTANINQTATISVTCVNGTPYQVGLDNGLNANGNVRRMLGGGDYVVYELYRDSARTQRWGNTLDTDTVLGTGNGSAQPITLYGRVPPQTMPTPGNYADTVTVSVYY
jgi:spore coat protein U-like protein